MSELSDHTIELLVGAQNERGTSGDLSAWAVGALEQGADSASLRKLAATQPGEPVGDALPYFWRALGELGYTRASGEDLLREYAAVIARRVVAGTLPTLDALEKMHRDVITPLKHPEELMAWCYLWEGNDPNDLGHDLADLSDADYAEFVFDEAQRFLIAGDWKQR